MQEGKPAAAGPRVPAALIIVLVGLVVTLWQNPSGIKDLRFGPTMPQLTVPTKKEWLRGTHLPGSPQVQAQGKAA